MKIRKIKNNILNKIKCAIDEKELTVFEKDNCIYRINGIENENIIIIYKIESGKKHEIELFEIV